MLAFKTDIVSMQLVEAIFTKSNMIVFCIDKRIIAKIRLHAQIQNDNSPIHIIKYDFAHTQQNSYT